MMTRRNPSSRRAFQPDPSDSDTSRWESAYLLGAVANWHCSDPLRLVSFAVAAVFGSVLKLRLPGVRGMVSVSALFILIGIVNLSLPEALAVGALSMLVQCTWRTSARPQAGADRIQRQRSRHRRLCLRQSVRVLAPQLPGTGELADFWRWHISAPTRFPIATIIGLTEKQRILKVWSSQRWLLPYYVAGASMAWVIGTLPRGIQWEFPIICLPLVYLVHRSNRTHVVQMEQERAHMQAMNGLHLRTIEALALAIDAKDHTTHDHLQRVQLYAVEIGKDLGLSEQELEALTAAAVLHDIGKLAVPESIISKPGKLTRSEFEKMKIHPVVGAEILERVEFPYPVVPIVRSHHEKWDGSGYPYGLRGEEIPIGARILAGGGLPGRVGVGPPVSPGAAAGRGHGPSGFGSRNGVRSQSGSSFASSLPGTGGTRQGHRELRPNRRSRWISRSPRGGAPAAGFEAKRRRRELCTEASGGAGSRQSPRGPTNPVPDMPAAGSMLACSGKKR